MKKVLVGCATADVKGYCLKEYVEGLKRLSYKNCDILIADNSEKEDYAKLVESHSIPVVRTGHFSHPAENIRVGMEFLRKKVLDENYDYFLCLEQDVIPPSNIIELLLSYEKDIISAVVPHLLVREKGVFEMALLGFHDANHPGKYVYLDWGNLQKYKEGIIKVNYCGTACILISRKVLEKISFRYEFTDKTKDNPTNLTWQDICFCVDVGKNGFSIYAHLGAKCRHLFYDGYCATLGDTTNIKLKHPQIKE